MLAALLLRCNAAVPLTQLIDSVWEEAPPTHARTVVHGHVSRLRVLFGEGELDEYGVRLSTHGSAYLLELPKGILDVHRFEELVKRARQQERPEDTASVLREALGLWRGPALTGTVPSAMLCAAAQALEETRLSTVERLAEVYGLLGDFPSAVSLLKTEAAAYPLRESLTATLMNTLFRAGRQSDALDWYHRTRTLLAEKLGIGPGCAMRAAYEEILRGDMLDRRPSATAMPQGLAVESAPVTPPRPRVGVEGPRTAATGVRAPGQPQPYGRAAEGRVAMTDSVGRPLGPGVIRRPPETSEGKPVAIRTTASEPRGVAGQGSPAEFPLSAHTDSAVARFAPRRQTVATPPAGPRDTETHERARHDDTSPVAQAPDHARRAVHEQPVPRTAPGQPVPRLLPRAARGFHGRNGELAALDRATDEGAIALLTGAAGVGKTALALHWSQRRQERFPDGALFADLRGFSTDPVQPDEVVREFLLALGVKPRDQPETAVGAAALYREMTADSVLLVVLDNARSVDQVRPLLPTGSRSATLVTSRLRLSGLIAEELARPVPLDLLDQHDAVELLASAVGPGRVAAEPEAAARLAALCDGLPLALRITAAQLATRPRWKLTDFAAELADEQRRLSLLSLEDSEDSGVAAALRLTVQGLPAEPARLFALLGALPGPDIDRAAAAALSDRDPAAAAEALDRLTGAHLLTEYAPGRYSLHDLIRLYARGLPRDRGALLRLLDSYVATALAAAQASAPDDQPCCTTPPGSYVPCGTREFTDRQESLRWYAAERENLAAAVTAARSAGHDDRAWRLVVLQWPYITWNSRDGWVPPLEEALDAAVGLDDPDAETRVRALLGWVLLEEDRLPEALPHLELAPGLAARANDPSSEATALVNLALALERKGDLPSAHAQLARATELVRTAGDCLTELLVLELKARLYLVGGAVDDAVRCTTHALSVLADRPGLPAIRHVMLRLTRAEALSARGEHEEAAVCVRRALKDAERLGYKEGVARAQKLQHGLCGWRQRA
ncbi:AfsR/SARP family transcriptional regulator [Streptomyces lavendulae]|uniref:AfsR/SARP family transcriptional regulator n=1 Tax=Streptomyces lavendulae TaxID=1914 RepID=UPI0031EA185F